MRLLPRMQRSGAISVIFTVLPRTRSEQDAAHAQLVQMSHGHARQEAPVGHRGGGAAAVLGALDVEMEPVALQVRYDTVRYDTVGYDTYGPML